MSLQVVPSSQAPLGGWEAFRSERLHICRVKPLLRVLPSRWWRHIRQQARPWRGRLARMTERLTQTRWDRTPNVSMAGGWTEDQA